MIGLRMPPELTAAVDKAAKKHPDKPSRSEMLRRIARDWLTERGFLKAP